MKKITEIEERCGRMSLALLTAEINYAISFLAGNNDDKAYWKQEYEQMLDEIVASEDIKEYIRHIASGSANFYWIFCHMAGADPVETLGTLGLGIERIIAAGQAGE